MLQPKKERLPLRGISYLIFIVFLSTLSNTILIPIFPLYLKNLVSNDVFVGYIFTFIAVLFLGYTLLFRKLIGKIKKIALLRIGLIGNAATLLIITIITSIKQFLILELFRTFFLVAAIITMGLFIREYSSINSIGRTEGQYFTILNIGFLIGPLLGGLLASASSYNTVFIISAILKVILALILFMEPLKEREIVQKQKMRFLDYIKNKQLLLLYVLNFGLVIWFITLYTFLPLYISENGFSEKTIGYLLSAAVIPLILLEIPVGKFADKYGFKNYMFIGFLIMGLLMLNTYFTSAIATIIIIIIATSGAAFVEPLVEAYFFKQARKKENEEGLYPIYKTSTDLSQIIFPIIFSTVLLFSNFKTGFLIVGVFMLLFSLLSLKLTR